MKRFIELGNNYAKKSTWKDFALVKFCLCAMGVMIGLKIPKKYKENVMFAATGIFFFTYLPLIIKTLSIAFEMQKEEAHPDWEEE